MCDTSLFYGLPKHLESDDIIPNSKAIGWSKNCWYICVCREHPAFQKAIDEYAPDSPSEKEFESLSKEILRKLKAMENELPLFEIRWLKWVKKNIGAVGSKKGAQAF